MCDTFAMLIRSNEIYEPINVFKLLQTTDKPIKDGKKKSHARLEWKKNAS